MVNTFLKPLKSKKIENFGTTKNGTNISFLIFSAMKQQNYQTLLSIQIVTGPSFTSLTFISAAKTPVLM